MQRKLASIQKVLAILPIENADAIELVQINGWQCVTKKGEFDIGDLGVFLEIDSIPPDTPVFRFLWTPTRKYSQEGEVSQPNTRPEKFRIRTLRLRGTLSQGLFLPLGAFPELPDVIEGDDVTTVLGVEKYEPAVPVGMGGFRAHFPGFISKTDEMRIQSLPAVLEELRGLPYVVTLKYDGTSATYCIDPRDNLFHACGRNFSIQEGTNLYWETARKYNIEGVLRQFPHYAIQGEIVGPGVQKNPLALKVRGFFAFNVYDIPAGRYLNHAEAVAFLNEVGIPTVEVL